MNSVISKIKIKIKKIVRKKKKINICKTAILDKKSLIKISKSAEIKDYVIIRTYLSPVIIGDNTQINPFTVIYGGAGVIIGKNVMIAPHCMIASGNHNYKQLEQPMIFAGGIQEQAIVIEEDVWIGANTTITGGVHIGRGSVIGAGAVVTHSIDPYSIVVGVPAKMVGSRMDYEKKK